MSSPNSVDKLTFIFTANFINKSDSIYRPTLFDTPTFLYKLAFICIAFRLCGNPSYGGPDLHKHSVFALGIKTTYKSSVGASTHCRCNKRDTIDAAP